MKNHLQNETSPYLLQHAENPVDWYPWGEAAFAKARAEDKPVFLSIGYSTCHWCHVMAHESFEDPDIAALLNDAFVSVKVDREERPDVDALYMAFCMAFTGSGGWPLSVFLTPERKPFFAGTYFPKTPRRGAYGFRELLGLIRDRWRDGREELLSVSEEITDALRRAQETPSESAPGDGQALIDAALGQLARRFDAVYGGFGAAPKFPTPQLLLFLLQQYEKHGGCGLAMAEKTLLGMYRGGLFDHIGGGFSRYSTDRRWLVPHFEKMLYDNALLILAYSRGFSLTKNPLFLEIAAKTAAYVLTELKSPDGGFYTAQDADSGGGEGQFYLFSPDEVVSVLGKRDGQAFCERFGITEDGNFEGKSIPNLLGAAALSADFDAFLPPLRAYRKSRAALPTDDKILTAQNGLMIAALCALYRVSRKRPYLDAARRAQRFLETSLSCGGTLFVSIRNGRRGEKGFLDDYAGYTLALLALYDATLERAYLERAAQTADKAIRDFFDRENGGFFLSGAENEALVLRSKESRDGASPSGNSWMTYCLGRLSRLAPDGARDACLARQLAFQSGEAARDPSGHAMFLTALSDALEPPASVTVVGAVEDAAELACAVPWNTDVRVLASPEEGYRLKDGQTAFYVCRGGRCLAPMDRAAFLAMFA